MATTTSKYNFTLPEQSDNYDVDVFNDNFQKTENLVSSFVTEVNSKCSFATNVENAGTGGVVTKEANNSVTGTSSVILGGLNNTINGNYSGIIGGQNNSVSSAMCFACGSANSISTTGSFSSVAMGLSNYVSGNGGFAIGNRLTLTSRPDTIAIGHYNVNPNTDVLFVVGGGTSEDTRNNVAIVTAGGRIHAETEFVVGGLDYAECFEWEDGNPNADDRIGLMVAIKGGKIKIATANDVPIGIISGTPSIVGNNSLRWSKKYKTDVFGRFILDEDGNRILNEDYDDTLEYVPRSERPEWGVVGMMGQIVTIDDGTLNVNDYAKSGENGIAVVSITPTKFRVMERLDETHVKLLVL